MSLTRLRPLTANDAANRLGSSGPNAHVPGFGVYVVAPPDVDGAGGSRRIFDGVAPNIWTAMPDLPVSGFSAKPASTFGEILYTGPTIDVTVRATWSFQVASGNGDQCSVVVYKNSTFAGDWTRASIGIDVQRVFRTLSLAYRETLADGDSVHIRIDNQTSGADLQTRFATLIVTAAPADFT